MTIAVRAPGRSVAMRAPALAEQAAADHDVIAASRERDIDRDRLAGAQRRGHGRFSSAMPSLAASAPIDFVDDRIVRLVARLRPYVRLGIDRLALDQAASVAPDRLLEQRPVGAPLDALAAARRDRP